MSNQNIKYHIALGATILVGVLGAVSALSRYYLTGYRWKNPSVRKASLFLKNNFINKNKLLGGFAGGVIGGLAALLAAPKAGSDLIHDLSHPFSLKSEIHKTPRRKTLSKNPVMKKRSSSEKKIGTKRKVAGAQELKSKKKTFTRSRLHKTISEKTGHEKGKRHTLISHLNVS